MSHLPLVPAAALPRRAAIGWPAGWSPLALFAGAAMTLVAEQARRIAQARARAARAPAVFSRSPPIPHRRVLLVGDSTGAGVGCTHAAESIAARLAGDDFGEVEVRNLCTTGATVAGVADQLAMLPAAERFDLVLVFAGGNDVLRRTPWRVLEQDVNRLLEQLQPRCRHVLWAGMANVGLAPLFLPPFSWWMTHRTRRVNCLLARQVRLAGAAFVDFFCERDSDPFSAEPSRYYADDGVHPSAEAYAFCYARLRPGIAQALAPSPAAG